MNTKKCSEYLQNYIWFSELGNICCFIVFLYIDKLCCFSHKTQLIDCTSVIYKIIIFVFLNYRKCLARCLIETLRNIYCHSFGYSNYSFYFWNRLMYDAPDYWKNQHSASQRSTFAKKYSMNKVDLKFISKLQSCHDMLNTQMGRIDGMIINNSCFQGKYG